MRQEQIDKKDYWNHELRSLGIHPKRNVLHDLNLTEDLRNFADAVKQSMYQDYKIAYGKDGDKHKEEAESTIHI
jgi:hypothetical protein